MPVTAQIVGRQEAGRDAKSSRVHCGLTPHHRRETPVSQSCHGSVGELDVGVFLGTSGLRAGDTTGRRCCLIEDD